MKIKYEIINNVIEIPDCIFKDNETEDERNMDIFEYILEHFNENVTWEVIPAKTQ